MAAETKSVASLLQPSFEVEKLVALEAVGMRFRPEIKETAPQRLNFANAILLLAFDAVHQNVLLELASQMFFKFAGRHTIKRARTRCPSG